MGSGDGLLASAAVGAHSRAAAISHGSARSLNVVREPRQEGTYISVPKLGVLVRTYTGDAICANQLARLLTTTLEL